MASLRVGLGRGCVKMNRVCFEDGGDGCWARGGMVKFGGRGGGRLRSRLRVVSGGAADSLLDHKLAVRKRIMDKEDAVSGKVDKWIRDSVDEIVSNIEEAPFLVHIYPENDLGSSRKTKTKVVREKAEANSWPNIKHRWERGSSIPNGIALVEELKIADDDDVLLDPEEELGSIANDNQHCSSTKVFGIVIQERGLTCPACYILKTSRVRSIAGICTHFCMFRVECFGETPDAQLKKQWLL
ncbi:hypothetical protein LIER_03800 [Lithospermum erythrorhizon]|uniref:DUF7804 domain-containing protein n=1 Tax=Lithospermum erythrorhizon TaxID=34254 RepID=A0AAV3NVQ7_LITER